MPRNSFLTPRVRGAVDNRGVPAIASGHFTTDGANDPSEVGGVVASVRRLVDTGPHPFFRVKLNAAFPTEVSGASLTVDVKPAATNDPRIAYLVTDLIVADPADPRSVVEIDIALRDPTDPTGNRLDTAGCRISLQFIWSS